MRSRPIGSSCTSCMIISGTMTGFTRGVTHTQFERIQPSMSVKKKLSFWNENLKMQIAEMSTIRPSFRLLMRTILDKPWKRPSLNQLIVCVSAVSIVPLPALCAGAVDYTRRILALPIFQDFDSIDNVYSHWDWWPRNGK